jgi:hypothetical protein
VREVSVKPINTCRGSGIGEHRFVKFDEVSVVCERCAERRVVAEAPAVPAPFAVPYVPVVPCIPYVPSWPQPNWWSPSPWPHYQIWSDTGGGTSTQLLDVTTVIS